MENGGIAAWRVPTTADEDAKRPIESASADSNHSCSEDDYVGACAHSATAEQVTITVAEPCRKNDPAIRALGAGGMLVLEAAKMGWLGN